ncbi:hypothetical protein Tco_0209745 [Tanacetum coccineum]
MESVKKYIDERAQLKREYDRMVNKRLMQTKESNVDSGKALNADSVVIESSGIESEKHDTSSRSGNGTHAKDVDIKPVNDKDPMAEVQLSAQHNVLANEQQHSIRSEPIYDTYLFEKVDSNTTLDSTNMSHKGGEIDQDAEKYQVKGSFALMTRYTTITVEPKSHTQKPSRHIAIGQRISLNKSSVVHEKQNTPRSCLRWKPEESDIIQEKDRESQKNANKPSRIKKDKNQLEA